MVETSPTHPHKIPCLGHIRGPLCWFFLTHSPSRISGLFLRDTAQFFFFRSCSKASKFLSQSPQTGFHSLPRPLPASPSRVQSDAVSSPLVRGVSLGQLPAGVGWKGWKKLDIVHTSPGALSGRASPLLVQAQAVNEMMKDLWVWGFCWYPCPRFCECEGWVVSRHSVQSFIPKQLSADHGPLSHIPFRGWIQSFFCSLSPSFLIYGTNIYSELLWRVAGMQRMRHGGHHWQDVGSGETREGWGFQKGGVVRRILYKVSGCERLKDAQRLWEEGHWAFPQEHPVK